MNIQFRLRFLGITLGVLRLEVETVRGVVSLKKYKSLGKVVRVTVNSMEEISYDFCLDFVQEFGLWSRLLLRS